MLTYNMLIRLAFWMLKNIFSKIKKSSICLDFYRIFELLLTNN